MEEARSYESYPGWIVLLCNLVPAAIYAIGATILAGFGILVSVFYLLFCLWLEIRVLRKSCVNCYYYGKVCGTGKGKLCAVFFKKGNPRAFVEKEATWADVLPDFLVSVIPLVGGIILLIRDFSWATMIMLAILVALAFGGTAFIRGSLFCRYCEQRKIGCPAAKLFFEEKTA
jgi:hypothetical protein